jgi:hypothetical protein
VINPCESNPCGSDHECITSEVTGGYGCIPSKNLCERLKPCNNNSECVYSKESNTFDCRCLNGAKSCDEELEDGKGSILRNEVIEGLLSGNVTSTNETRVDMTNQDVEIPKVGFNYDNVNLEHENIKLVFTYSSFILVFYKFQLYWILPLCLVVFVVAFFLTIVIYFGFKARYCLPSEMIYF